MSRAVVVPEVEGRLVEVVAGRLGPAAVVDGAFAVVAFLSVVEVEEEVGAGRLAGPAAGRPPLAAAELGRVLAAAVVVLGLVAPATGCDAGSGGHTGTNGGAKNKKGSKK